MINFLYVILNAANILCALVLFFYVLRVLIRKLDKFILCAAFIIGCIVGDYQRKKAGSK